jgi:hypothetical protein
MEPQWNGWLGKTKDDRMVVEGPPDRCAPLQNGGEVCEWRSVGAAWEHRRIFVYDREHVARSWTYQGTWGTRRSASAGAKEGNSPDGSR